MFERYVAIDWSGAGEESQRVDLRVVEAGAQGSSGAIVKPPTTKHLTRKWTRGECRAWLASVLRPDQPRCIVAMDFGFGLPWGADRAIFSVEGWRQMLAVIAELYHQQGTARAAAEVVNRLPALSGHGPFRFNDSRTDFRFYLDHYVAYYRLVDITVPQAISHWYLGSGGTVGFHTITGLATLHDLLRRRDVGELAFHVWPHEGQNPSDGKHLVAECYPALYPRLDHYEECQDAHERDAWRTMHWMVEADRTGLLQRAFHIRPTSFGRVVGLAFDKQIGFEGWILGVM